MVLDYKAVLGTLGALVFFLGVALFVPALVALGYGESDWSSFVGIAVFCIIAGGLSWRLFYREAPELRVREGFAIVAFAWVALSVFGAIPFMTTGTIPSFTDAFFETMSGFTTTGATVLGGGGNPSIEDVSHSVLFWRSLTHWIGGMGIIVLTLAILPLLGVGGMQLFKAEVPGPSADKLTPRVQETAKRLWLTYVGITVAEVLALLPSMDLFDAVNHAFATMATGGFSTRNASVGAYQSAYVDWVITIFMVIAGANFALHYRFLRGKSIRVFRDTEFRVYLAVFGIASLLVSLALWAPAQGFLHSAEIATTGATYDHFLDALRFGAFQTASIISTTGFATVDYLIWPPLAVGVIFLCFFVGGMAGSTGGGIKVIRHILLVKNSFKEVNQLIHPQAVIPIRLNDRIVSHEVMRNVLSFIVFYLGMVALGTFFLALFGADLLTAFGAAVSSIGNIGPAFGGVGPADNYAFLSSASKWTLSFLMLAGRLELFTVVILFFPSFWKR